MVAMAMLGVVAGVRVRGRRVAQRRRDSGGLDGDHAGVHNLTVHLHHHLIALGSVVEALCGTSEEDMRPHPDTLRLLLLTVDGHGRHHKGHLGPAGFVVADGRQKQVVLRRRHENL